MVVECVLLHSRQGKVRLQKWYTSNISENEKRKKVKDIVNSVISRKSSNCNFIDWQGKKIVYKRYASLYFVAVVEKTDNELITLELIHRYVELLDVYFGNVCELDIIFNFEKAFYILDEYILAGELQETSKMKVISAIEHGDRLEEEVDENVAKNFLEEMGLA